MTTDVEREIRDLLAERAGDVRAAMDAPPPMLRRARRRRVGSALVSSIVLAGIVAGGIVGARALLAPSAAPSETRLGGPADEPFAVWPQTTREEARQAQECVDDFEESCIWQLNALEVVRRYGEQQLGWREVFVFVEGFIEDYRKLPVGEDVGSALTDVVDPLSIVISECLPPHRGMCEMAELRVEKPLRPDVMGIWLITDARVGTAQVPESPPPSPVAGGQGTEGVPPAVFGFVERLMDYRRSGSGAEQFLSDPALDQYERGEGGLSLYGYAQDGPYEAQDAFSTSTDGRAEYRVVVSIVVGDVAIHEELTVAERPDGVETGPEIDDYLVVAAKRFE